jgi:hypothetical protein
VALPADALTRTTPARALPSPTSAKHSENVAGRCLCSLSAALPMVRDFFWTQR